MKSRILEIMIFLILIIGSSNLEEERGVFERIGRAKEGEGCREGCCKGGWWGWRSRGGRGRSRRRRGGGRYWGLVGWGVWGRFW